MDMVPPRVIGVSAAYVQFFPPRQFLRRMASLSPEASAGTQGNWLQTVPGKGYVAMLRLYSPTAAAITTSWKPSDIEKVNAVVKERGCVAAASRHLFYAESSCPFPIHRHLRRYPLGWRRHGLRPRHQLRRGLGRCLRQCPWTPRSPWRLFRPVHASWVLLSA